MRNCPTCDLELWDEDTSCPICDQVKRITGALWRAPSIDYQELAMMQQLFYTEDRLGHTARRLASRYGGAHVNR